MAGREDPDDYDVSADDEDGAAPSLLPFMPPAEDDVAVLREQYRRGLEGALREVLAHYEAHRSAVSRAVWYEDAISALSRFAPEEE